MLELLRRSDDTNLKRWSYISRVRRIKSWFTFWEILTTMTTSVNEIFYDHSSKDIGSFLHQKEIQFEIKRQKFLSDRSQWVSSFLNWQRTFARSRSSIEDSRIFFLNRKNSRSQRHLVIDILNAVTLWSDSFSPDRFVVWRVFNRVFRSDWRINNLKKGT